MKTFIAKDGELRLYALRSSVSSGGSWVKCKILFCNSDFTAPLGRNRPEETLVLDRMKFDCNTHFIQGSDAAIAEPLACSFSLRTFDRQAAWEAINWVLNGRTLASSGIVLGTTKGTCYLNDFVGKGYLTNNFTDSSKKCFNVELHYDGDAGGRDMHIKLREVFFNPGEQTVNEAEDSVTLNLSGMIYGSIDYASADFSAGSLIGTGYCS